MATKKSLSDLKDVVADNATADKSPAAANKATAEKDNTPKLDAQGRAYGTGRRKDAVARVWIKRGTGKITVNDKDISQYFARGTQRLIINQAFEITARIGQFDIIAVVAGGGLSGQAGAVRHGLSRALCNFEPGLRAPLKAAGFLTRDSRIVERKKYGKHKARKSTQWVKR